jgi:hypothetical protein
MRRACFLLALSWGTLARALPADVPAYQVRVGPAATTLAVEAIFPKGSSGTVVLEDGGERFLRDLEVAQAGSWTPVRHSARSIELPRCSEGCRVRYRFLLQEAAEALADPQAAAVFGGAFVSPPSTWLLHEPVGAVPGFRLRVATPEGIRFLSGLPRGAEADSYFSVSGLAVTPLCAFGAFRVRTLDVGGAPVTLAIAPVPFAMGDEDMERWVAEATQAVAAYYRRFPATQLLLLVVPDRGQGLSGFTLGEGGASILIRLGTKVPAARARAHWVLTHELMHLGFPSLTHKHLWMEEGMAVFGEPLVRVRAGMTDASVLWTEWLEQGPLGLPRPGEGGLETTHTWARTYWGGAVFWLFLDVTLRERTGNAKSADDVLRALVAAGGNVASRWEVQDVIRSADAAVGSPAFSELFHRFGEEAGAPDLPALFQRLGVSLRDGTVVYDEAAPLAAVRRAMVARGH